MTHHFPIVIEQEANGTWSAWVAGLPGVYAAADTLVRAKRAIKEAVTAHLAVLKKAGRLPRAGAELIVLRYEGHARQKRQQVRFVGLGALLGRTTSAAKAAAARRNGRKGGRPVKTAVARAR